MIDIVLILVVFVLAASLGGYVYYRQQQANKVYDAAGSGATVTKHTKATSSAHSSDLIPAADPTANWTAFSSTKGKFSLKYPKSWNSLTCGSDDSTVFLAGDVASKAICNSGNVGQIEVDSSTGNSKSSRLYTSPEFASITTTTVMIDSVSCSKQTATGNSDVNGVGIGSKRDQYICYKNGLTYVASYQQSSSQKDYIADFDTMVIKTLKFN